MPGKISKRIVDSERREEESNPSLANGNEKTPCASVNPHTSLLPAIEPTSPRMSSMGGQRRMRRDESMIGDRGVGTHSNSTAAPSSKITMPKPTHSNSPPLEQSGSPVPTEAEAAMVSIPKLQLENLRAPVRKVSHSQKGGT